MSTSERYISAGMLVCVVLASLAKCQEGGAARDVKAKSKKVAAKRNWYQKSFFLLHEDHHSRPEHAVGRGADPVQTAKYLEAFQPDVIQIHAKGKPGWTTYPSKVGFAPPKLERDVLKVWKDIARRKRYHWSIYYNIGRDAEIMKRHPEWNRSCADGSEADSALCYHSGVAEKYLWPMIDELTNGYDPDGFWFDGSVFTVEACYCDACRKRFLRETGKKLPRDCRSRQWPVFQAMQRQVYRDFIRETCRRIHARKKDCLVAFNWAYSMRMPEKPDPGVSYLTGDEGCHVEYLSMHAHWYDGVGLPFDMMTTGHVITPKPRRMVPKGVKQIRQEMAIIIANGGRYWLWDNPTPTSGLRPAHREFIRKTVAPFLRKRQAWCLGSRRLPDVSLLHCREAQYARNDRGPARSFAWRNNQIEGASAVLPRLHLNYEMVGDWRLHAGDVRSPVLIVEDPLALGDETVKAILEFANDGGAVLLTGGAAALNPRLLSSCGLRRIQSSNGSVKCSAKIGKAEVRFENKLYRVTPQKAEALMFLRDRNGKRHPLLLANDYGKGRVFYASVPLMSLRGYELLPEAQPTTPVALARVVLEAVLPAAKRRLTTDAPENVEIVLRDQPGRLVLHLVNMARGTRPWPRPKTGAVKFMMISDLPEVPASRVTVRVPRKPARLTLQPGNTALDEWTYSDGRVTCRVPAFSVHQMVVIHPDKDHDGGQCDKER